MTSHPPVSCACTQLAMTQQQSVSRWEQRSDGGRRLRRGASFILEYKQVHVPHAGHGQALSTAYCTLRRYIWRMVSQSSRLPGSRAPFGGRGGLTQCLWTEDRSCHPQRQPLTSMWRQSVAGQTQSSALQRQWRLGAELADGRQVIVTEGVVDALVAVEWSPCPGARRIGRGAGIPRHVHPWP